MNLFLIFGFIYFSFVLLLFLVSFGLFVDYSYMYGCFLPYFSLPTVLKQVY